MTARRGRPLGRIAGRRAKRRSATERDRRAALQPQAVRGRKERGGGGKRGRGWDRSLRL